MAHAITWFEIPAQDFKRAKLFYEKILKIKLQQAEISGIKMAMFPVDFEKGELGGSITAGEGNHPSSEGTLIYLNAAPEIQKILDRIEAAGGKILLPKTLIPMEGAGYMAIILDTEGNRIGLHSMQ